MRLRRASDGKTVQLDSSSEKKGGEGSVYPLGQDRERAAKVYHDPTNANVAKLQAMLSAPPQDPMARKGHMSLAWPIDLLEERSGQVVGFLMPRARRSASLFSFLRPKLRREDHPTFTYRGLHRLSRNVASAFSAVHAQGHIVGDVNPRNVLATEKALACLIDCDSFQIRDPRSHRVFVCEVGVPEFTPPEHQGKLYANYRCGPTHDRFGLAVLLFMLLMEGNHPFSGRYLGSGNAPALEERIAAGRWPYAPQQRGRCRPRPASPSPTVLSPVLQRLFHRCFVEGHRRPQARPDARTWKKALKKAERALVRCKENSQHWYGDHCQECPWCKRRRRLGKDSYPPRPESKSRSTPTRASEALGFSRSDPGSTASRPQLKSTLGSFLGQLKRILREIFQLLISATQPNKKKRTSPSGISRTTTSVELDSVQLDRDTVEIK